MPRRYRNRPKWGHMPSAWSHHPDSIASQRKDTSGLLTGRFMRGRGIISQWVRKLLGRWERARFRATRPDAPKKTYTVDVK
jgi:hypothetical protein